MSITDSPPDELEDELLEEDELELLLDEELLLEELELLLDDELLLEDELLDELEEELPEEVVPPHATSDIPHRSVVTRSKKPTFIFILPG